MALKSSGDSVWGGQESNSVEWSSPRARALSYRLPMGLFPPFCAPLPILPSTSPLIAPPIALLRRIPPLKHVVVPALPRSLQRSYPPLPSFRSASLMTSPGERDGGSSYQLPVEPSLTSLLPSSPLYTHCQTVVERHFHLHHQLFESSPPPSDTPAPSLALDLSRLDVELQAMILSLSHYNTSTSTRPTSTTINSTQDQQSLQVLAEMQQVSTEGEGGVTERTQGIEH